MEKTTKRIILAFIVGIITLYCSVYGFILYDSHTKESKVMPMKLRYKMII